MNHLRRGLLALVVLTVTALAPIADAGCVGTTCGAACENYACIMVTDSWDTLACKPVANAGCMSMNSLTCCPRIPRE